jgi:hypothetical protein
MHQQTTPSTLQCFNKPHCTGCCCWKPLKLRASVDCTAYPSTQKTPHYAVHAVLSTHVKYTKLVVTLTTKTFLIVFTNSIVYVQWPQQFPVIQDYLYLGKHLTGILHSAPQPVRHALLTSATSCISNKTSNVCIMLMCICATTVAVAKQSVLYILSVFVALVTQHAKHTWYYIVTSDVSGSTIFVHILLTGMIFGRKLLKMSCVFWFSLQHLSEIFVILRIILRDIIINVHVSM